MGAFGIDKDDPFAAMLAPPPGETSAQRSERERREIQAQKISDRIDEELKLERAKFKKQTVVRVLLLGQSESGKSTTLKNFRMKYARAAWKEERNSWRSVIQLNLLRSVLTILGALQAEMNQQRLTSSSSSSSLAGPSSSHHHLSPTSSGATSPLSGSPRHPSTINQIHLTDKHQLLKLRLTPLRRVEQDLKGRIGAATEEDDGHSNSSGIRGGNGSGDDDDEEEDGVADDLDLDLGLDRPTIRRRKEFGVRDWKGVVEKQQSKECLNQAFMAAGFGGGAGGRSHRGVGVGGGKVGVMTTARSTGCIVTATNDIANPEVVEDDDATDVIASCKDDMKALWADPEVRAVLRKRKVRLQDSAGFFMDDLDRIATRNYEPSDDDIVRARLRTLAVQEHRILFDEQKESKQFLTVDAVPSSFLLFPSYIPTPLDLDLDLT
ncbi:hypothetical protein BDN72DRAFT_901266 [Pluteus cervinus]|uniref:Uncharacterized protein n=1 Tax=Pluteus cervinus TaxID=181527 RepID=A0ACD3AHD5_9AGAR|nr:hypothetical protein BDN72DRAFT_901266 [Pluteus cervinus]